MRSTSAPRRTSTPASHSSVVMSSPARSPRRVGLRALLGRDEDDLEAAAHQRGRRLAGDEAGADDHRAGARRADGAQAQGVVDGADRCAGPGSCAPSIGRALRARSRWRARRRRRPEKESARRGDVARRARRVESCASRRRRARCRPRDRGGGGGQLACEGATPVPSRTRSAASSSPPARRTRERGVDALELARRGAARRPPRTSSVVMSSPARSPRRCGLRKRPRARRATVSQPAPRERRRRLAGDEAGADDDRARAALGRARAGAGRRRPCGRCAGRDPRRPPPAGAAAPSRWRARRRRRRAPGRPRGARRARRGRARPRGARGAASPRVRRTRPRPRAAGRPARPRRAGSSLVSGGRS